MTLIQRYDFIPERAANVVAPDGTIEELWVRGDGRILCLHGESGVGRYSEQIDGDPLRVMERRGYDLIPATELPQPGQDPDLTDKYHRRHTGIFAYDVIAPAEEVGWLRNFVRGPERSDSLPDSWSETKLTDGSGDHTHTLCSYKATVAVARGMAYVQRASSPVVMDKIAAGVGMVQRIAQIDGFSGWRSASALPDERSEELYEPGDLYQLIDPRIYDPNTDANSDDPRGEAFTTDDFLNARGLTRL